MEALTNPLWAAAAAARPRRITQGQARAMADIAARHAHEQAQLAEAAAKRAAAAAPTEAEQDS